MKKIGFKNFRKFEDFPSISFGNVTYLVGQNNAGKSTMVKAAILVLENLLQKDQVSFAAQAYFDFVSSLHNLHIDTFARACHRGSNNPRMQFSATIGEFEFEITVIPADNEILHSFIQTEQDTYAPIEYLSMKDTRLGVKISIRPFVAQYEIEFEGVESESSRQAREILNKISNRIEKLKKDIALENERINNTLVGMIPPSLLKQNSELDDLMRKQKTLLKSLDNNVHERLIFNAIDLNHSKATENSYSIVREIEEFAKVAKYDDANKQARLSSYDFNISEKDRRQQGQYLTKLRRHSEVLSKMAVRLSALLNSIDFMYIPAHLASQEVVLNSHTKDIFASVVDKYAHRTQKYDRDKSIYRYLQKWMDADHFNIGKGFIIEEKLPGYYTLTIETFDKGMIPVGDMGMGTNQLMILLLHIANKMKYGVSEQMLEKRTQNDNNRVGPIIFIEEPEQNLHPNLQSKLAEFFYELATSNVNRMQFIVETHSEYIIRKSQYIVASQRYKDEKDMEYNPQKVYFFSSTKPAYDMHYHTNGVFEEPFEPGFYDMASDISMETLALSM